MDLRSIIKMEQKGFFFFTLFYLIAGIANLIVLGVYGLDLFHVALVAVVSFLAAYGLYKLQSWSLWLVMSLFFIATTYGAFMLNAYWAEYSTNPNIGSLLASIAWIIYLIFTWIATIYVGAKRKVLQ